MAAKAITKLTREIKDALYSVKEVEKEFKRTEEFATAKNGVTRLFLMNQYAECFRECGVESRQEFSEVVQQLKGDPSVEEAHHLLLQAEEEHATYIEEINTKLQQTVKESSDLSGPTEVNNTIPDIKLINANDRSSIGIHLLLASTVYTVLVLIRHYG